jgi:uncharacterized membrane protein
MPRDHPPEHRSWLLQRPRLLSHADMLGVYSMLCLPPLLVALLFAWQGYWQILAYALLEVAAIGALLLRHELRAGDYDRIELWPDGVAVEQRRGRTRRWLKLDTWSTRVNQPRHGNDPIRLEDHHLRITLGQQASLRQRQLVAQELSACLPCSILRLPVLDGRRQRKR